MKSNKSSKSNSPTKSLNCDFSTDPHVEFEAELNRSLGIQKMIAKKDESSEKLLFEFFISLTDKSWREKAEKELNENNETCEKIKQLRGMIKSSEINRKGREDESFLLRFLRAKKFDVDKAFKMIQKYYWMKEHSPELFHVSPPSDLKMMLEMQIQSMLNTKDQQGRQIYLFRVGRCKI